MQTACFDLGMQTTVTLSNGTKIRCASQRRFVVIHVNGVGKAFIAKRSDTLHTAMKAATIGDFVVDTVTGEELQTPAARTQAATGEEVSVVSKPRSHDEFQYGYNGFRFYACKITGSMVAVKNA